MSALEHFKVKIRKDTMLAGSVGLAARDEVGFYTGSYGYGDVYPYPYNVSMEFSPSSYRTSGSSRRS